MTLPPAPPPHTLTPPFGIFDLRGDLSVNKPEQKGKRLRGWRGPLVPKILVNPKSLP